MAENPYVNKVIYGDTVLVDLSADTVTPETLMEGVTAHDKSGAPIVGTGSGGGSSIEVTHGTISAGNTSITVSYTGDLMNFYCVDSVSGEVVKVNEIISADSVTFSIAQTYTNSLTCTVISALSGVKNGDLEDF